MGDRKNSDSADLLAVQEVLQGNPQAFEEIVLRYREQIYRLSFGFLHDSFLAEDAAQEIFIKAFQSLPRFALGRRFHPWLYTIALNHLKNRHRSHWKVPVFLSDKTGRIPDQRSPSPERELEESEEIFLVRKAVQGLPPRLKEVIILFYFEDMKVSEISETLGIGEENVKSRLFRGRRKLRKKLAQNATGKPALGIER